jgi:hypothetical protein
MQTNANCSQCKWWEAWGCNNSNWMSGTLTDPNEPVCDGLFFAKRAAQAANPGEPTRHLP